MGATELELGELDDVDQVCVCVCAITLGRTTTFMVQNN